MSEETTKDETIKPMTGFAVFFDTSGNVFVEREIGALSVGVERESTMVEVRRACSEILMDLNAQAAAEYTVLRFGAISEQAKQGQAKDPQVE
jgi:hypothetical protein